jgi:hypothetical protein
MVETPNPIHNGKLMRQLILLLGVLTVASCGGNRSDDTSQGTVADTTEGSTLKVPGDSVRLEDTLSAPPPTDSGQ